jgi:hypothetical protein
MLFCTYSDSERPPIVHNGSGNYTWDVSSHCERYYSTGWVSIKKQADLWKNYKSTIYIHSSPRPAARFLEFFDTPIV